MGPQPETSEMLPQVEKIKYEGIWSGRKHLSVRENHVVNWQQNPGSVENSLSFWS